MVSGEYPGYWAQEGEGWGILEERVSEPIPERKDTRKRVIISDGVMHVFPIPGTGFAVYTDEQFLERYTLPVRESRN